MSDTPHNNTHNSSVQNQHNNSYTTDVTKTSLKHDNDDELNNATSTESVKKQPLPSTDQLPKTTEHEATDNSSEQQLALQVVDLQHQLDTKQKLIDQLNADHLRSRADMDNYKKRLLKERTDAIEFANQSLISGILEVLDNFDRALHANTQPNDLSDFKNGISLIYQQLQNMLRNDWNVIEIDALKKEFDPVFHEAVGFEEDKNSKVMTVCDVLQKGYSFKGRVIRHARVKVKKPVE